MSGKKICIVGSGNWGSVIAKIVGENAHKLRYIDDKVTMYVYEEMIDGKKLTEIINTTHENVKYLPGHKLPPNVVAIPDLVEAAADADFLVFVVPHQFVKTICNTLVGKIKPTAVAISLIKYLPSIIVWFEIAEEGGIELISNVIKRVLKIPAAVLMGANLAGEVAEENFCETTIGCADKKVSLALKEMFETDYFRVVVVEDVETVEICGALKNIVACAAGFCDGLKLGDNTKAAVIRLGLMEMIQFVKTFYANCKNRRVSEAFVTTGRTIEDLEKEMLNGQKLQGPITAHEVNHMLAARKMEEKFPLFTAVHMICKKKIEPKQLIDYLKNHPVHQIVREPEEASS
ncbi:hypothetical protein GE061_017973 [Apolygus lucorum]|uniref:Glycerol-3-phosphate dehydrogenase [NAD(+)] n=1 Tax=Apolygus lucorum TaxID=248454 RepID=A0A8S9XCK4_APOLU|nr:hypothetical protein GE061_017973 [Apolygus lucorum]